MAANPKSATSPGSKLVFALISAGAALLSAVACATKPLVIEQPSRPAERADLDGVYEYTATVTEQNVTRSGSQSTTRTINGTFSFADGRLVQLDNDYSTPCRVEDSGPAAPMRSMDPHIMRVSCPDLTMTITLDRGEALQSYHIALRVRVVDTIERRGGCAVRDSEGQCIQWEWILSSEQRWRSPTIRITRRSSPGD